MARQRDPRRDQALEIYLQHNGEITNRAIADQLNVPEKTISNWKSRDKWGQRISSETNVVLQSNERSTTNHECSTTNEKRKNKGGAPKFNKNALNNRGGAKKGNQYAVGNRGGGAPPKNKNAETHGFFSKIFPEEALPMALDIMEKNPIDMLWENIIIQYTAIARAQKLMFVQDQNDMTKELKKEKLQFDLVPGGKDEPDRQVETYREVEYEIQFAWDKHATFLNAQSRAMTTLAGLTEKFMQLAGTDDKRRLELEKMMQSMETEKEKLQIEKEKLELMKKPDKEDAPTELVVRRWSRDKSSH